jgi:hypothetical protein
MAIASVYFLHIVYSLYHWFWQYIQCCLLHPAIESIFIIDMLLVHIIIGYVFSWCCPVHIRMRFYPERCSVLMAIYFVYIPNVVLSSYLFPWRYLVHPHDYSVIIPGYVLSMRNVLLCLSGSQLLPIGSKVHVKFVL